MQVFHDLPLEQLNFVQLTFCIMGQQVDSCSKRNLFKERWKKLRYMRSGSSTAERLPYKQMVVGASLIYSKLNLSHLKAAEFRQ